ncbi:MAG: GNAT family N-acetyltransferase [Corynebacterium sp.]|nr:GNAT family N-acetyltransferase [Corynebacterium sp.]
MKISKHTSIDQIVDPWKTIVDDESLYLHPTWIRGSEPESEEDRIYGLAYEESVPIAGIAVRRIDGNVFATYDPVEALFAKPEVQSDTHTEAPKRNLIEDETLSAEQLRFFQSQQQLAGSKERLRPAAVALLPGSYVSGLVRGTFDRRKTLEATSEFARRPGLDEVAVLNGLVDFLETTADQWGTDLRSVMHVPVEDVALVQVLQKRGYLGCVVTAQCEIPVPESGFEGYLSGLSGDRRRKVRKELTSFEHSGFVVRRFGADALDDDAFAWRMAELQAKQLKRYGHSVPIARLRGIVEQAATSLRPWVRVVVAEREGKVEAFVLSYADGTTIYPKMAGWTEEARQAGCYFVLGYYEQIKQAGEAGLRVVNMGPEAFYPKVRRGAQLRPRMMFVRSAGGEIPGLKETVGSLDVLHRRRIGL